MKKFLLIVILLLLTGVLFLGAYQLYPSKKETPIITEEKTEKIPSGIPPIELNPSTNSVSINDEFSVTTEKGKVDVKDFRKNVLESNSAGEMLLVDEKDYQIVYYGPDQSFLMTLYALPILETQKKAEDTLLRILKITKEEACRLKISIGVPYQLDPNYIGVRLPLSFCS